MWLPHKVSGGTLSNDLKIGLNFGETFVDTVVTRFQIGDRFWIALITLILRFNFRRIFICEL